jgi:hypothetical protein
VSHYGLFLAFALVFLFLTTTISSGSLVFLSMMIGDANNEEVDGLLIISFIP